MTFEHSAVFDHPIEEVFAWHGRRGAIRRLMPPWQPVRVRQESDSLESGRAVLAMPGGLAWLADHRPDGYEPGRRFTDVLATRVLGSAIGWRHTHDFSEEPGGRTRITDRVETRVPERLVREMFAYRTRQLTGDLAAHSRWAAPEGRPLTVAVTGSSGLIGSALCALLSTGGHRVVRLVRSNPSGTDRLWRPEDPAGDLLDGIDALVHLAGASIAGRFSEDHKAAVRDSRVEPTRRLAELAARSGVATMVSSSAIGFYGADRGDEELTEASERGEGFLADVVVDWEKATAPAAEGGVRVALIRTGIVQSPKGGSLRMLRPLFEAGLGGRLGDGHQWMAWIGIDDLLDVYLRSLVDPEVAGPLNAVAPEPVRNDDYTRVLARVLHRPAVVPVPGFGPELLLGREGAKEVAAASQRVLATRLIGWGHPFRQARLEPALRHVLGRSGGASLDDGLA